MRDQVCIKGLKVDTVIGVYDWEREILQTVVLDLTMDWDNRPAANSDDLQYALDYAAVSARLMAYIKAAEFELIETLAERCAEIVLQEFSVPALVLEVSKPGAVPEADTVSVRIARQAAAELCS